MSDLEDLKEYQCIRKVHAKEMSLGEFNELVGAGIPGKPESEGFLLVYNKETEDQHVSWAPAERFKNDYTLLQ